MPSFNLFKLTRTDTHQRGAGATAAIAVASFFVLTAFAPLPSNTREPPGDDVDGIEIAQNQKGGKGKQGGGSSKSAKNVDDANEEAGGGKHCPAGQSTAPLRGRGGSASTRGAGCM